MKDNQVFVFKDFFDGMVPATILQKIQLSTLSLRCDLLVVKFFYGLQA